MFTILNSRLKIKKSKCLLVLIVFSSLFVFAIQGKAQDILVTNFYYDQKDLTANQQPTAVLDQNGAKCALIRVQTTHKGFVFDVGSLGIVKVEDNRAGEIWLWVPQGVRHISIRHAQLGSLSEYYFPINVQRACAYIMEIAHREKSQKSLVPNHQYDSSQKQHVSIKVKPSNASFSLNSILIALNEQGESEQNLEFGEYSYKVEAEGYNPKEGKIVVDGKDNSQLLEITDLVPITGELKVQTNTKDFEVLIDGNKIESYNSEKSNVLQIGKHVVMVRCHGYNTETREVNIKQGETTSLLIELNKQAVFQFTTTPAQALFCIDGEKIGYTPCSKLVVSGRYIVEASKDGYKRYKKKIYLDSSTPAVNIKLQKMYVNKNRDEAYLDVNYIPNTCGDVGATVGLNFRYHYNMEVSLFNGQNKLKYKIDGNTPSFCSAPLSAKVKLGYAFVQGSRTILIPQVGIGIHDITDDNEDTWNDVSVVTGLLSLRCSIAITNHFAVSLTPELPLFFAGPNVNDYLRGSHDLKKYVCSPSLKLGVVWFFGGYW